MIALFATLMLRGSAACSHFALLTGTILSFSPWIRRTGTSKFPIFEPFLKISQQEQQGAQPQVIWEEHAVQNVL